MAGAGYKLFVTGDVLTAAQVNTYLQEQTVMSFADAAARTSALSAVLAEGMMSYLRDTNAVQVYNGSAWVAVGGSSPLTTKGDLYGFSTLDARVPIGTNNQVLTADSAQALGLKWATPTAAAKSYTLLGTGTTTSGSTVTVSGISGINTLYVIVARVSTNTAGSDISFRINADSGANYAYYGAEQLWTSTYNYTYMNTVQQTGNNQVYFNALPTGTTTGAVSAILVIDGCNSTNSKVWSLTTGGDLAGGASTKTAQLGGVYSGSSTVSSFSL